MKLSGLIIETSTVHSTKSARPLSIVKFVFLCDNEECTRCLQGAALSIIGVTRGHVCLIDLSCCLFTPGRRMYSNLSNATSPSVNSVVIDSTVNA